MLAGVGSTYFGYVCGGCGATGFRRDRLGTHQHTRLQIGLRVNLSRDRNTHSTYMWLHSSSQDSSIPSCCAVTECTGSPHAKTQSTTDGKYSETICGQTERAQVFAKHRSTTTLIYLMQPHIEFTLCNVVQVTQRLFKLYLSMSTPYKEILD